MNYFLIGRFLKPYGLRGDIKVQYYVDDLKDLKSFSRFYIQEKSFYKEIELEALRETVDRVTVKPVGCDDRTKAEVLQGRELFVDEAEIPSIKKKNSFYIKDLMGMEVLSGESAEGQVRNVFEIANRMMMIIGRNSGGEIAVPLTDEYVENVDVTGKKIYLKNLEKLI